MTILFEWNNQKSALDEKRLTEHAFFQIQLEVLLDYIIIEEARRDTYSFFKASVRGRGKKARTHSECRLAAPSNSSVMSVRPQDGIIEGKMKYEEEK